MLPRHCCMLSLNGSCTDRGTKGQRESPEKQIKIQKQARSARRRSSWRLRLQTCGNRVGFGVSRVWSKATASPKLVKNQNARNIQLQKQQDTAREQTEQILSSYIFVVLLYFWRDINPQHHNEHLQLAPIGLVSSPSTCQVYVFTGPRVPRSPAGTKNKQWTNRWIAIASTELGLRLFRIKSVHQILTLRYMGLPECGFLSLTQGETYIHKHPHILSVFCQSAPRVRKASPSSSRWNMPPWRFQKTRNRRAGVHKRNDVHPFIHISKPKGSLCVVVPTSSKWLSKCPWRLYRVYFTNA